MEVRGRSGRINDNCRVAVRWFAFIVWAVVAASTVFWGLRLGVGSRPLPAGTKVVDAGPPASDDLSRLFGPSTRPTSATPVVAPAPPRYKLLGVVAARQAADSPAALALIAIDDKPAKAYRVGAELDGNLVLTEVRARGVSLGPRGGPALSIELPPPAPAVTSALPLATFPGVGGPGPRPRPMVALPTPVPVPHAVAEDIEEAPSTTESATMPAATLPSRSGSLPPPALRRPGMVTQ